MINIFKNLTKKKIGGLLLILIIIIAFGFGGFGGGFNIGNQNNIAKINKKNITTQDFMDYLNQSGLSQQVIKENIDKNIIEELLSTLISTTLLNLEIKDLELSIPEETLIKRIQKNVKFHDKNGNFKRTLYEKFLLLNNTTAPIYERKLKNNALQKQLFTFISGGTKSPKFLVSKYYKEKMKKLSIDYINLENSYKKKEAFTNQEVQTFISENSDKLKREYIDFSYVIITPKKLTGLDEFNQTFFDKIDDIENKISKNIDFKIIIDELNMSAIIEKEYTNVGNKETIENKIFNSRKDKIEILEDKGTYIFYQIDEINTKLPDINDDKFEAQIRNLLFKKEKFQFNKNILNQIDTKKFNQALFNNLGNNNIKKIILNSIEDTEKFEINSIKILYSLPINSFALIADDKDNIFVAKIINYKNQNISQNSSEYNGISNEASAQNRNNILKSYDYILNNKYKVVVNEKTLDRVKSYFR